MFQTSRYGFVPQPTRCDSLNYTILQYTLYKKSHVSKSNVSCLLPEDGGKNGQHFLKLEVRNQKLEEQRHLKHYSTTCPL